MDITAWAGWKISAAPPISLISLRLPIFRIPDEEVVPL